MEHRVGAAALPDGRQRRDGGGRERDRSRTVGASLRKPAAGEIRRRRAAVLAPGIPIGAHSRRSVSAEAFDAILEAAAVNRDLHHKNAKLLSIFRHLLRYAACRAPNPCVELRRSSKLRSSVSSTLICDFQLQISRTWPQCWTASLTPPKARPRTRHSIPTVVCCACSCRACAASS